MARKRTKKATKSSRLVWLFLVIAIVALAIGIWVIREKHKMQLAEAAIYKAFGIDMPRDFSIHGIDVSAHQNTIAWKKVKAMNINHIRMHFAILKATEGLGNTDKKYTINRLQAKQNGLVVGAYHFFLCTKSGAIQARNFIANARLASGDLPPVVDIEQLYGVPPETMRKRLQECLTILEAHYKTKPILYTYVDFYEKYLQSQFADYPLWIAHYLEQNQPRISKPWLFWQHSERGHINGITTYVDCNVFNGNASDFQEILLP